MKTSFLDILSSLSDTHIAVLNLIHHGVIFGDLSKVSMLEEIVNRIDGIEERSTARLLLSDLERLQLLEKVTFGKPTNRDFLQLEGSEGVDDLIGAIEIKISCSKYGKSFIDFVITSPISED
jgi:hypothetical protein